MQKAERLCLPTYHSSSRVCDCCAARVYRLVFESYGKIFGGIRRLVVELQRWRFVLLILVFWQLCLFQILRALSSLTQKTPLANRLTRTFWHFRSTQNGSRGRGWICVCVCLYQVSQGSCAIQVGYGVVRSLSINTSSRLSFSHNGIMRLFRVPLVSITFVESHVWGAKYKKSIPISLRLLIACIAATLSLSTSNLSILLPPISVLNDELSYCIIYYRAWSGGALYRRQIDLTHGHEHRLLADYHPFDCLPFVFLFVACCWFRRTFRWAGKILQGSGSACAGLNVTAPHSSILHNSVSFFKPNREFTTHLKLPTFALSRSKLLLVRPCWA